MTYQTIPDALKVPHILPSMIGDFYTIQENIEGKYLHVKPCQELCSRIYQMMKETSTDVYIRIIGKDDRLLHEQTFSSMDICTLTLDLLINRSQGKTVELTFDKTIPPQKLAEFKKNAFPFY